jgi:hypothetical protein
MVMVGFVVINSVGAGDSWWGWGRYAGGRLLGLEFCLGGAETGVEFFELGLLRAEGLLSVVDVGGQMLLGGFLFVFLGRGWMERAGREPYFWATDWERLSSSGVMKKASSRAAEKD